MTQPFYLPAVSPVGGSRRKTVNLLQEIMNASCSCITKKYSLILRNTTCFFEKRGLISLLADLLISITKIAPIIIILHSSLAYLSVIANLFFSLRVRSVRKQRTGGRRVAVHKNPAVTIVAKAQKLFKMRIQHFMDWPSYKPGLRPLHIHFA